MTTLDKIKADVNREYKWLVNTKYTIHDVDIAFGHIRSCIDKYAEQDKLMIIEANVNGYTQGLKDAQRQSCESCKQDRKECGNDDHYGFCQNWEKSEQEPRLWNNHQVACLLADMFGDNCACNFNGIDEWLPKLCDFKDTCCPKPVGVACWEQFLKHSRARYCECGYEMR